MRRLAFVLLIPLMLVPGSARAQTDFSATSLAAGQIVRVTDPSGASVQGAVTEVLPLTLRIDGHVFRPVAGLKVERLGDSLWNGAAIGFAAGALLGGSIDRTGCFDDKGPGCVIK